MFMIVYNYLLETAYAMVRRGSFNTQMLDASGIRYYPHLGSTNTEARRLAEAGAPESTVVLPMPRAQGAAEGRSWHSPPVRIHFPYCCVRRKPIRCGGR